MARIHLFVFSFLVSFVHYGSSSTAITLSPSTIPSAMVKSTESLQNILPTTALTPGDTATMSAAAASVSSGSGTTANVSQIVTTSTVNVALSTSVAPGPPTTKKFEARMTVNETYKAGYSNTSSSDFKTFVENFNQTVGDFLSEKLFGFQRVKVKKLASGSVVVDFDIVVLKSSNATVDSIVKVLNEGNGAGLGYTFLGNVTVKTTDQPSTSSTLSPTATVTVAPSKSPVTPTSSVAPSKSPVTPTSSVAPSKSPVTPTSSVAPSKSPVIPTSSVAPSKSPVTPTSSTKATEFWDKAIDLATPLGTFIIVVVAVALIIILLIALICLCCKYRKLKKKTRFPEHLAINNSEWIRSSDDLLMWERNLRASEVKTTNGVTSRPFNEKRT